MQRQEEGIFSKKLLEEEKELEQGILATIHALPREEGKIGLKHLITEFGHTRTHGWRYMDFIAMLLGKKGDSELVEFLVANFEINPAYIRLGYERGCHVQHANKFSESLSLVAQFLVGIGYAMGGHIEQVNLLLEQKKELFRKNIASGYAAGGHLEQTNLLRLITLTKDDILRKNIVSKAKKVHPHLNFDLLLKRSDKITFLMKQGLTFEEAQAYLCTAVNIFLFQGRQLVGRGDLPTEMYFYILSFVMGCSVDSMNKIYAEAEKRINQNFLSFFASAKVENPQAIQENYEAIREQRRNFYLT